MENQKTIEDDILDLFLEIDTECALLEDVLHDTEGKRITYIRKLLIQLQSNKITEPIEDKNIEAYKHIRKIEEQVDKALQGKVTEPIKDEELEKKFANLLYDSSMYDYRGIPYIQQIRNKCIEIAKQYAASQVSNSNFQSRVDDWMQVCFGEKISKDSTERNHRFLEESLELVQSLGCTKSEAHQLVDYVFNREIGEPHQ